MLTECYFNNLRVEFSFATQMLSKRNSPVKGHKPLNGFLQVSLPDPLFTLFVCLFFRRWIIGDVHFALFCFLGPLELLIFSISKSTVFPSSLVWESKFTQGFPAAKFRARELLKTLPSRCFIHLGRNLRML